MSNEASPSPVGHPASPGPRGLAELLGVTAVLLMLRRRLAIMALAGASVAVAAFAFLMLRAPTYDATALVMINPRQERVLNSDDVMGQMPRDSAAIDSEIELLKSPALMNELVEALGMTRRSDVAQAGGSSDAAANLAKVIEVRRRGLTYVIEITAHATDPRRAQLIANTYADVYIASQVNQRVDTVQRANSWLSRRKGPTSPRKRSNSAS